MNRRKGAPSPSALAPPADPLAPNPPSSRSASPSSGLAQFLAKPKSWFVRSASASKVPSPSSSSPTPPGGSGEGRTSSVGSAGARKHKISRPTDPRPILDGYATGSRSVLDLSQPQPGSLDKFHASPSVPTTPVVPNAALQGGALGDLRSISRKPWSRSADDLNGGGFSPVNNVSFQEKIAEYRGRSDSNASASRHPFPTFKPQPELPMPARSATLPTVSISVSPPRNDGLMHSSPIIINSNSTTTNITTNVLSSSPTQASHPPPPPPLPQQPNQQSTQVHTRSHSFTPKLPSKLSNPKLVLSPKRKGSGSNEREIDAQSRGGGQEITLESRQPYYGQTMTPTRAGFIFPFSGGSGNRDANHQGGTSATSAAQHPNKITTLLTPTIIDPKPTSAARNAHQQQKEDTAIPPSDSSKQPNPRRASQIVYHSGFINRLANSSSSSHSPFHHHHHGYLGRGGDNGLALAKGWKAYKMELKGAKLFFYKPPSDRNAGIKELFPTGLVPPSLEDDDDDEGGAGSREPKEDPFAIAAGIALEGKGKAREDGNGTGRKRRAFWGRRAHPDLVRDVQSEKLEKGTFEALIHEAVFATTFLNREHEDELASAQSLESNPQKPSASPSPHSPDSNTDDLKPSNTNVDVKESIILAWKLFASAVLLSLPNIIGRQTFEAEFMRCCAYLISGADEENGEKEREKERVVWLVKEYLGFSGVSAEGSESREEWEEWIRGNLGMGIGDIVRGPEESDGSSSGGEGLVEGGTIGVQSPNLGTFSPRPDESTAKFVSLMEALGVNESTAPSGMLSNATNNRSTVSSTTSASKHSERTLDLRTFEHQQTQHQSGQQPLPPIPPPNYLGSYPPRIPWHQLHEEGLSREIFLMLDPYFVAKSLTLFHRSVVDSVPEMLTAEHLLLSSLGDEGSMEGSGAAAVAELDAVFGNEEKPHWLTKLILLQILSADARSHSPSHQQQQHGAAHNAAYNLPSTPSRRSTDFVSLASPSPSLTTFAQSQSQNPQQHPQQQPLQPPSRTHSRSEVISVWAKVGELCRVSGDECTWRAIAEALCSRPLARLEKVWKRVDSLALNAIEGWVYPSSVVGGQSPGIGLNEFSFGSTVGGTGAGGSGSGDGAVNKSSVGIKEPRATPWGGNIRMKISQELAKVKDNQMLSVSILQNVLEQFDGFRSMVRECPKRTCVEEGEINEDVKKLVAFWRDLASQESGGIGGMGGGGGMAAKLKKVEQFMALSIAAEPRKRGLFEPHFWAKVPGGGFGHGGSVASSMPSNALPNVSLVPLIFPEPLPSVTLIDRTQLIRGRLDSDASDIQHLRSPGGGGGGGGGPGGMDPQLRILQRSVQNANEVTKRLIMGIGGTVISLHNGELMLVVQPGGMENPAGSTASSRPSSRAPSRPPSSVVDGHAGYGLMGMGMGMEREKPMSRAPSIRVKPTSSHGLERKTSVARRNSLPSLSQRQNFVTSEKSSDPPLRVLVQAGTLNALVNILVHGLRNVSVSVADDNGEMTLKEGMTRELVVDRMEFARVWWNVFRSFLTPLVFFELLRKMYITTQPSGSSPSVGDYLEVLASRTRVLELISDWLTMGGGAQDVLDDPALYAAMKSFLNASADHVVFKTETFEEPDVAAMWVGLVDTRVLLQSCFDAQTKRPTIQRTQQFWALRRGSVGTVAGVLGSFAGGGGGGGGGGRARGASIREPPDLDGMDPEDLVEIIDGMARAALSNVTEEDLYVTADLLEVQTSDRTGWFSAREVGHSDEVIEIQNMYTHIQEVEPSSLISEMTQDTLYRLLPPGIRICIRAYGIIRKWLIAKLVTPRLGLRGRQARMELLLQTIEVARLRNAEPNASHHIEQPCVRSFVEAVVTSAIISVESRMHQRPWQFIAYNRQSTCDSMAALLARPYIQSTNSRDCLTVDMGWLIERMLEVIASPDVVVEPTVQDGQNLVNFDKRRHLCNLVGRAISLPFPRKTIFSDEAARRGFERLNVIEREVLYVQFDHRGIREESTREALGASAPPSIKKVARPFQKLVAFQMEKNRRDRNLRSRLQKEKLQEQSRNDRREDMLNKGMRTRKQSSTSAQKAQRNKKSMSAFLSFMRPISSAFGADLSISSGGGVKRTAAELDFQTGGKPSLVLSVMDAKVAQFINNERSFTFQLDTEDGGHYILQALNKKEMNKWLDTINQVTSTAAKRRLTYMGPKPQFQDHFHEQGAVASRDPLAVFAVELEFLLQRGAGGLVPPGTVPILIDQCLSEVETRGLTEVGIYRIAGAVSEINALKDAYNRGEYPIRDTTDIHAVCDLVKAWFRVLPEPLFPPSSYHDIMSAMRIENLEDRLTSIRNVVRSLPQANYDLLKRVSEHLDKVTDYEESNQMTAEALAIVFSPNLLRAPQNDFVTILNNMGQSHKLVKALITHFQSIFDEADPEAEEVHSEEDDMETPILEEDEDEEEAELSNLVADQSQEVLRSED